MRTESRRMKFSSNTWISQVGFGESCMNIRWESWMRIGSTHPLSGLLVLNKILRNSVYKIKILYQKPVCVETCQKYHHSWCRRVWLVDATSRYSLAYLFLYKSTRRWMDIHKRCNFFGSVFIQKFHVKTR